MAARRDWLIATVFLLVALSLRLWRIEYPQTKTFDEVYYVDAAENLLAGKGDPNWVHPPLGKWLIASGIMIVGDNSFGWRLAPALSGAICVLLAYLLSLRLFDSRTAAFLASLFLMLDPLSFVHSRIGMLDIFLPLFSLLACLLLVQGTIDQARGKLWFALSGMAIGASLSVKWSLLPMLLVLAVSVIFVVRTKEDSLLKRLEKLCIFFIVLPAAIYLLSYLHFFSSGRSITDWLGTQGSMLNYHLTMKDTHPDAVNPILWWIGQHLYYIDYSSSAQVWAKSNPYTWVPGAAATFFLGFEATRGKMSLQILPTLAFAAQYLIWFISPRIVFLFYMIPIVPFLFLSLGFILVRIADHGRLTAGSTALYVVGAIVLFALNYPTLAGIPPVLA